GGEVPGGDRDMQNPDALTTGSPFESQGGVSPQETEPLAGFPLNSPPIICSRAPIGAPQTQRPPSTPLSMSSRLHPSHIIRGELSGF
ncbi:hypothetical protein KUCAC02_009936, partial [Chaenocephalus aceratus]